MKHPNDAISTRTWVKQMKDMVYNRVLLFKCQGDEQSQSTDDIGKDDFVLIIQTKFQKDALMKYGNNAILVDSTHGLTHYDFYLTTVMVIDEHGEGLPVSWAVTNREDTAFLVQYFKALHNRVGNTFMTDCAEQFSLLGSRYLEKIVQRDYFVAGILIELGRKPLTNTLQQRKTE